LFTYYVFGMYSTLLVGSGEKGITFKQPNGETRYSATELLTKVTMNDMASFLVELDFRMDGILDKENFAKT